MKNFFNLGERKKRAAELVIANKELAYQNKEKERRAQELVIANKELAFQNEEKEKRAAELVIANQELLFQNAEKEKRAAELVIANQELLFQNTEKEKRAAELAIANQELLFQNEEKEKRASELVVANKELLFQNNEKEKRAAEMVSATYARSLLEASVDPLLTISADGKISDVNNATVKITGVSRKKLIGSDFTDYFTDPEKARAGYKQVFSQEIVRDFPLTMRNAAGLTTDVLYNASIYKNETGEVQGVFASARDITESKKLEKELSTYREQLEEMVKQRTNDLSNVIMEVRETVSILVSTSSQILAATSQVATGTAQTATSISETSTTVEEVQQAAKQTAEKARNVANSAQRVAEVSKNGQKAVEETISGMNRIREHMDSIAVSVIHLSEQSQSIGGIIASVTDIADQSNLLAVNAAIEAAKAGEQGRGFAVVAQEIKNLAGQSKQATLQVRNILNDIQKATGTAVMATEQGSKAVESGVKQSAQAGEAILALAESINEAVQSSTQIVASSQQQVVGMDQISMAMRDINQAGTETAVSMVQSEKSAKNLNDLGQKLKETVEKFKA
jgi:PAS domain S-box-containing protein